MSTVDHMALEVSGVTKQFVKREGPRWPWKRNGNGRKPVVAVDHVSFQVRRGEVFGILGPNGSGKSTLVRCIATLLLPDEGHISVFGHDVLREEMAVKQLINRVRRPRLPHPAHPPPAGRADDRVGPPLQAGGAGLCRGTAGHP